MRDGTERLEINYSFFGTLKLVLVGILMTMGSGFLAFRVFPDIPRGSFAQLIGYLGLALCGLATIVIVLRPPLHKGPVIIMTETGLTDTRLATEEIPWHAIHGVTVVTIQRSRLLVIDVDPAVEDKLTLTRTVRRSRRINAAMGIDGLCTSAQGLDVSFDRLFDLVTARAQAAFQQ